MKLKVLLPFEVLLDESNVYRIVAETRRGFFGLWPQRLDCVALLIPSIIVYQSALHDEQYVAVDEGVLVKTGPSVTVSVHNAVIGSNLGQLRHLIEAKFRNIDEEERKLRTILAKMESNVMRQTRKLQDA